MNFDHFPLSWHDELFFSLSLWLLVSFSHLRAKKPPPTMRFILRCKLADLVYSREYKTREVVWMKKILRSVDDFLPMTICRNGRVGHQLTRMQSRWSLSGMSLRDWYYALQKRRLGTRILFISHARTSTQRETLSLRTAKPSTPIFWLDITEQNLRVTHRPPSSISWANP